MSLQDYVTAIEASLERLAEMNIRPRTIVGHSQGGLLVQMLQQRKIDQGTNIRQAFGIRKAILLAPVPAAPVPWELVTSGTHLVILGAFLTNDPTLGQVVFIPGAAWPAVFFSNLSAVPASGTPPVAVLNTFAFPEPLLSSLELTGTAPIPSRPVVQAGIFASNSASHGNGTVLYVAGFEQDTLVRDFEAGNVYDHLTERLLEIVSR